MVIQPEFIYAAFVLPALFSITLIIEGLEKVRRKESGLVQMVTGLVFLAIMVDIFIVFLIKK